MSITSDRMAFLFTSSVLMCLGWGLRGYIGGGPLGAMIPGAFLALWFCMLLGVNLRRAAIISAFSAVGIGFGGEMTYGQTLGFLRDDATLWWGVLGTLVKGGAWGLLGGAVMGLGFVQHRLSMRQLGGLLFFMLVAIMAGIMLINHPKLIYFSDPVNKPRAEVWAGLILGGLALLAMLRPLGIAAVPTRFAAYGSVGGLAGFGIGGMLMAIGFRLEPPFRSLPWWKFMEFTFGALLGLALGWAALHLRDSLRGPNPSPTPSRPVPWRALSVVVLFVSLALVAWNYTAESLIEIAANPPVEFIVKPVLLVLLGYSALGCTLLLLATRYQTLAWHTAITMTFLASVIDLLDDIGPESPFNASASLHWSLLFIALVVSAGLVMRWQRSANASLHCLLLGLMWACMAVAYGRIVISPAVLTPSDEQLAAMPSYMGRFMVELTDHGIVHGIFTACAVYATVAILLTATPEPKAFDAQEA